MWIYTTNAMLSIVEDVNDRNLLHVRARARGEIEGIFPSAVAIETPDGDYKFRVSLPRDEVRQSIAQQVQKINYTNFKDTIPHEDIARHDAYFGAWQAAHHLQQTTKS